MAVCEGLTQRDDSPVYLGVDAKYFLSNRLGYGKRDCCLRSPIIHLFFSLVRGIPMEYWQNDANRGKRGEKRRTCPSVTLPTTNLTGIDLGPNPGLRGDRLTTKRLSHFKAPAF